MLKLIQHDILGIVIFRIALLLLLSNKITDVSDMIQFVL